MIYEIFDIGYMFDFGCCCSGCTGTKCTNKAVEDEYQYGGKPSVAVPLAQDGQKSSSGGVPLKHPSKKQKLKEKFPRGASIQTPKKSVNPSKDGEFEIAPKK